MNRAFGNRKWKYFKYHVNFSPSNNTMKIEALCTSGAYRVSKFNTVNLQIKCNYDILNRIDYIQIHYENLAK